MPVRLLDMAPWHTPKGILQTAYISKTMPSSIPKYQHFGQPTEMEGNY
jgi:hypothetical protein